jgi:CheY-like chemotaxis protein
MLVHFQDILSAYLVPFALAVPLAILLFLLVSRRDTDDTRAPRPPVTPPFAPPPPAAPPPVQRAAVATAPVAAATPPVSWAAPPAPEPVRVLVADDSAVARAKLRKLFEGAGYEVALAEDGEQALELIASQPFSVLITDLEMPKLDGFQVIASVQGSLETEDMPIIAITGHEELSARVNDCQGLYGIFKKPWNDRELLKRVATVATLRRPAATG